MRPRAHGTRKLRDQVAEVADARPGEEDDVDREVEQHGPAGDKPEHVTETARHEVLAAAGNRIGSRQLRVRQPYADVDEPGEQERNVRGARRGAENEPKRNEDVGADVRVAPRERTPGGNLAP